MSRKRKGEKPEAGKVSPRGYDTKTIRDFLEHLLWGLRIAAFEATSKPGTVNPELVEQLAKFADRDVCLIPPTLVEEDGCTPAEFEQAHELMRGINHKRHQVNIEQLEALGPLFSKTLDLIDEQAKRPNYFPLMVVHANDFFIDENAEQQGPGLGFVHRDELRNMRFGNPDTQSED